MDFKMLSTLMQLMHKDDNCNFDPATDSLEAIRDVIDASRGSYSEYTSGSGNWSVPSGVKFVDVLIVGGGGGGCGASSGTGAGGGGGEVVMLCNYKVDGLGSVSYSVGSGGSAGQSYSPGGNGGSSSFHGITAEGDMAVPVRTAEEAVELVLFTELRDQVLVPM